MPKFTIYHNPRCSKSRATLAILEAHQQDIEIIKYLETPPTEETIKTLLVELGMPVTKILRKNETDYKEHGFATAQSDDEIIKLIHQYPKVMERPIVSSQGKAVIGRPPENVLELWS